MFNLHGRLYGGFWITPPKAQRDDRRIDGKKVADLDFTAMFPAWPTSGQATLRRRATHMRSRVWRNIDPEGLILDASFTTGGRERMKLVLKHRRRFLTRTAKLSDCPSPSP